VTGGASLAISRRVIGQRPARWSAGGGPRSAGALSVPAGAGARFPHRDPPSREWTRNGRGYTDQETVSRAAATLYSLMILW